MSVDFAGRIVILGFGSIGSGLMPLLYKHFKSPKVTIITKDTNSEQIAEKYGAALEIQTITKQNYHKILQANLRSGDFLVNLTVDVDSLEIIKWCAEHNVLYVDTVVEPWAGYYTNPEIPVHERSNYWLRQKVIDYRSAASKNAPTAVIAHGANPGLVSHFVKAALLEIADITEPDLYPQTRQEWVDLAYNMNIKVIHVAERDTQVSNTPKKRGEFVNTWSVEGFISEGSQPAELGWGSHEKALPPDGRTHEAGCKAAIYINQPGLMTKVRSWTPDEGPMHAWVITHNEAISIADYFSGKIYNELYRPTVHYAYHPCDAAVNSIDEICGHNFEPQDNFRIITDEVVGGVDELGVLLMGNARGSLWYGSHLSIEQARAAAPHNNATSLQVVAPVIAAMEWAIKNPRCGIVEADEMPFNEIIDTCRPYLGNIVSKWTDWTPLSNRQKLFEEKNIDHSDPWQFINFRV